MEKNNLLEVDITELLDNMNLSILKLKMICDYVSPRFNSYENALLEETIESIRKSQNQYVDFFENLNEYLSNKKEN